MHENTEIAAARRLLTLRRMRNLAALLLGSVTTFCSCVAPEEDDPIDASFVVDPGGADTVGGVNTHGYEADAFVDFVQSASLNTLWNDVGLGERTANAIVTARSTRAFASLYDVDAAPFTGETFFVKTLEWIRSHALLGSCGDGLVQPSIETCDGGPACTACRRTDGVQRASFADEGRRIADQVPLPGGGVALLSRDGWEALRVQQLTASGTIVSSTVFTTNVRDNDANLVVGLDGKVAVTFEAYSITVAGQAYSCDRRGGCGYVFTLRPDGGVDAGRAVGQNPRLLSLSSGDWALLTTGDNETTVSLLDRATLTSVWDRREWFDTEYPVGPYLAGANICVLNSRRAQWDMRRVLQCRTPAGQLASTTEVTRNAGETFVASREGIIGFSPSSVRALTPGMPIPASIPFATLPFTRALALGDGRLVVSSAARTSMIGASGQLQWEYPAAALSLAVGQGVVLAHAGNATLVLEQ